MLDRKTILEDPAAIQANCVNRGADVDIDRYVKLDARRRPLQNESQELNRQANEVSKSIGKAKDDAERDARKSEGRQLREKKTALDEELSGLDKELEQLASHIPNLTHPEAPIGDEPREVGHGVTPVPTFDFSPQDHVVLGENLDLVDLEAGAKVAGHGFYYLKNEAVLLDLALQQWTMRLLVDKGFTPIVTPDLARHSVLAGVGFIPRGPETQIYNVENSDLGLIATAEITLGGLYADTIFDADQLPIKLCGISHCFRTEAGAHGRATRGLYRVHQFTKVEMFAFTLPEQSDAFHDELCAIERQIFDQLEVPYRVIDTPTGDLGGPAYRKFDLEAWMPGRGDDGKGAYGEITSTSNCTDYQARRLGIRYRTKGEKGTRFVHTLNGTAVAISRALIAILENNQRADGSISIPTVLRPWVGRDSIEPRGAVLQ